MVVLDFVQLLLVVEFFTLAVVVAAQTILAVLEMVDWAAAEAEAMEAVLAVLLKQGSLILEAAAALEIMPILLLVQMVALALSSFVGLQHNHRLLPQQETLR
jgi:hypothetical protein